MGLIDFEEVDLFKISKLLGNGTIPCLSAIGNQLVAIYQISTKLFCLVFIKFTTFSGASLILGQMKSIMISRDVVFPL